MDGQNADVHVTFLGDTQGPVSNFYFRYATGEYQRLQSSKNRVVNNTRCDLVRG